MKIKSHEAGLQAMIRTMLEEGNIEGALKLVKDPTYYWDVWNDDDIQMVAEDLEYDKLTDKEVQEVMNNMSNTFDAEQGINWYVIRATIENIKGDK